jgi:hypothetical protein
MGLVGDRVASRNIFSIKDLRHTADFSNSGLSKVAIPVGL